MYQSRSQPGLTCELQRSRDYLFVQNMIAVILFTILFLPFCVETREVARSPVLLTFLNRVSSLLITNIPVMKIIKCAKNK